MIIKQIKGENFTPLCIYQFQKIDKKEAKIIDSNMLGDSALSLSREFNISTDQRPNLKKIVYHASLSIHPEEKLTNNQFRKIGKEFLQKMGFGNNQFLMVRHYDAEHPHIHIISSRVKLNGEVVSDKWDYRRAEKLAREFEKKYNLKEVQNSTETEKKALSKGIIENFKRTGNLPVKSQLQEVVSSSLEDSNNIRDLITKVNENGANIIFHHSDKKIFGLSFELDGVAFKASQLGKAYSWNKIKTKLKYDHEREFKSIIQTNGRGAETNLRPAGGQVAPNQLEKYRGAKQLFDSDSKINYKVDKLTQERISINKRESVRLQDATEQSQKYDRTSGTDSKQNEQDKEQSKDQNIPDSNLSRSIVESINVLGSIFYGDQLNSQGEDYDYLKSQDQKKKLKKKRRRKRLSK